jgi:hypothetical protein
MDEGDQVIRKPIFGGKMHFLIHHYGRGLDMRN